MQLNQETIITEQREEIAKLKKRFERVKKEISKRDIAFVWNV